MKYKLPLDFDIQKDKQLEVEKGTITIKKQWVELPFEMWIMQNGKRLYYEKIFSLPQPNKPTPFLRKLKRIWSSHDNQ